MNQILITKKLYVTPELRRKKKIYKFDFVLSIFLVIILISVCIYAEYDRDKSEEVSQEILEDMMATEQNNSEIQDDTTVAKDDSVLLIVLDEENEQYGTEVQEEVQEEIQEQTQEEVQEQTQEQTTQEQPVSQQQSAPQSSNQPSATVTTQPRTQNNYKTTADGYKYVSVATINIPKINVNYPILEGKTGSVEETDSILKVSPCKFWGPDINEVGNYCIVGHNWRNNMFFSKVPQLVVGDTFTITEPNVRTITYQIYDKYTVEPENVSCTSQLTGGKKEVTLITCTDDSSRRVIVKAREV